jgi:hypothetical protein
VERKMKRGGLGLAAQLARSEARRSRSGRAASGPAASAVAGTELHAAWMRASPWMGELVAERLESGRQPCSGFLE